MREYRVFFADGSQETLEAESIDEAREMGEDRWDAPIMKVVAGEPVVEHTPPDAEDDDEDEDGEEEGDEEDCEEEEAEKR